VAQLWRTLRAAQTHPLSAPPGIAGRVLWWVKLTG
jgi:hypothetical protein